MVSLSRILLSVLILFCLIGVASADTVIVQTGSNDYTIVLDPNIQNISSIITGTNGVIYTDTVDTGTFAFNLYFESTYQNLTVRYDFNDSMAYVFAVDIGEFASPLNVTFKLIAGCTYDNPSHDTLLVIQNTDYLNSHNIILDFENINIQDNVNLSGSTVGFGNVSISGLNSSAGNLDIQYVNESASDISLLNSKVTGNFTLSDVGDGLSIPAALQVNVDNLTLTNGTLNFTSVFSKNIAINNSNFATTTSSDLIFLSVTADNFELSNSAFDGGDIIVNYADVSSVFISELDMNGSSMTYDFDLPSNASSVSVDGLTVSDGYIRFWRSGNDSHSLSLTNSNITNGHLWLSSLNCSVLVHGNKISNFGQVLTLENLSVNTSEIFNNVFINSGADYIDYSSGASSSLSNLVFYKGPYSDGLNIMGAPWTAGNYWGTFNNDGYSDLLPKEKTGYSTVPYLFNITTVLDGTVEFEDLYPLTKLPSNNPGGSGDPDPTEPDPIEPEDPPVTPPEQPPELPPEQPPEPGGPGDNKNPGYSGSGNSFNSILVGLNENGMPTEEVIRDYIAPAAAVLGAAAGSILLIIAGLTDFFFDVSSTQVRNIMKGKVSFKFNPPGLSQILTARTAYLVLFFIFGIGVIDTFLGDAVDASLDGGLLSPYAAYISPLALGTLVNIGGGLFFDEILEFIFKRTGKFVNSKTGILDLISASGKLNAVLFVSLIVLAAGLLAFCIYFLEWSLL
ncbi:hypothetical protein [Methanimicrococcus hacksteinii]|uniref:hypothetical protein n=1 Tax=Methanimicrococcus hacksteinii TaxID=3028293 RepID=UPI00298EDD5F|nr:hypothetical protein [Methanimicrococcus sp. At1]